MELVKTIIFQLVLAVGFSKGILEILKIFEILSLTEIT